jgi:hypothetical protein
MQQDHAENGRAGDSTHREINQRAEEASIKEREREDKQTQPILICQNSAHFNPQQASSDGGERGAGT